jgi:hypothetical protein
MDIKRAIEIGQLVKAAEDISPSDLTNRAGLVINGHEVVATIYGNDMATDSNPEIGDYFVSYGLVLQAPDGDVVVAIRGTDGVMEWIHDAEFASVKFPFAKDAGRTDDGFTAIYESLQVSPKGSGARLASILKMLPYKLPVGHITICGHSLGGALATLLAIDLAENIHIAPSVFTFASPRVGDVAFVGAYNQIVPDTVRIVNNVDAVPMLPAPPAYEHVLGLYEIYAATVQPPMILVRPGFASNHHMTTYLHLLSLLAGGDVLPLDPDAEIL